MNFTPSAKSSFVAGLGFWSLLWVALFKSDRVAEALGLQQWLSSERCLRWIRTHRSATLLATEVWNYSTHGLDPLGVAFALGGTLTNVAVVCALLPIREVAKRRRAIISSLPGRSS